MKETVPSEQAVTRREHPLPPRVQEALGELVGVAQEGLLALSVGVGLGVLAELMARRLDDVRLGVLMLDGIDLKGRTNVVALGITSDGLKIPLGLWEGSTENATVATALLADLVARGLDTTQGVLCVLDGSKAIRKAVRGVLGERAPVQRCIRHKERNVLDHLPERDRALVRRRLRGAWADPDYARALDRLEQLAGEMERSHPGAAASLREGMAETLTLTRLGITGPFTRTLASTHPIESMIESMIECLRRTARNVKRWQSGEMALRWTAAGMLGGRAPVPADYRLPAARHAGPDDRARSRPLHDDRGGGDLNPSMRNYRKAPPSKFYDEREILPRPVRAAITG